MATGDRKTLRFSLEVDTLSDALVGLLRENHDRISHVYLSCPVRFWKSDVERDSGLRSLEQSIRALAPIETVLRLDYLCMGGRQVLREFRQNLVRTLEEVASLGIESVELGDPYLVDLFRSRFPPGPRLHRFRLFLGRSARIRHAARLRYLHLPDLHLVTLDPYMNRPRARLQQALALLGGRVELVANSGCHADCPMEAFCAAVPFHLADDDAVGAQRGDIARQYTEYCAGLLANEPWHALTLPFIRPEDVPMCEQQGVSSLRVLAPPDDPDAAARILGHYLDGRSPADLFGLLVARWPLPCQARLPSDRVAECAARLQDCSGECGLCGDCRASWQQMTK